MFHHSYVVALSVCLLVCVHISHLVVVKNLIYIDFWFTENTSWICRACERLKQMRIKQARPDPEKAAKTQELHRKLRVCVHNILKARRWLVWFY